MSGKVKHKDAVGVGGAKERAEDEPAKKTAAHTGKAANPRKRVATNEEESFPRGGAELLSALERREVVEEARREVDKELAMGGPRNKKAKGVSKHAGKGKSVTGGDAEDSFFTTEDIQGKVAQYVELLKFKTISAGMKVWGIILEVTDRGLSVSLPHGLRGHVALTEASDLLSMLLDSTSKKGEVLRKAAAAANGGTLPPPPQLHNLFHVGQYVRCSVIAVEMGEDNEQGDKVGAKRKTVELSLRLSRLSAGLEAASLHEGAALPACVSSVEDHGYMLSFGIKGVSGFLKRRDHEAVFGEGSALLPGMLLETLVTSASDKRNIVVTTDPAKVSGAVTREWDGLSLASLMPGSLVPAKVRKVLGDGLLISFLTYFHGTVDPFHLASPLAGAAWKGQYTEGQKLKVRILYTNPATKSVGLSLLPHLQDQVLPSPTPMLGQVFDGAAVIRRVDIGLGLLLELPLAEGSSCAGYVHISNVSDEREERPINKVFKVDEKVSCRVTGFRLVDGLATVSMKKSVIEQQVVSIKDIHPGQALACVISSVETYGLLVTVAGGNGNLRALVPLLHASDMGTAKALTKFKVGQKVNGRVLSVDFVNKRVQVTLKKGLMGSKLPILTSMQQAVPGLRVHGIITGVKNFGAFIAFYGNVHGLALTADLGLEAGKKAEDVFTPGQVVKARVVVVEPATGRMRLSLNAKKGGADAVEAAPKAAAGAGAAEGKEVAAAVTKEDHLGGVRVGDVVTGTIKQVHSEAGPDGVEHVTSYYVDVDTASASQIPARLEIAHLADHPSAIAALRDVMKPGCETGPLVVLDRFGGGSPHLRVSRKHSLVQGAAIMPHYFDDVKETAMIPGYISGVTGDAVFVRYLGLVGGRAGLAQLADTFVSDPKQHFKLGQSVRTQVLQVDSEKKRFSVTLRPKLTASSDASFLHSLLRDLEFAESLRQLELVGSGDSKIAWDSDLVIGHTVSGKVHEQASYGTICDLDPHPDLVGIVRPHQAIDEQPMSVGALVKGRVLDVNKIVGIVDLSLRPDMLAAAADQAKEGAVKKLMQAGKVGTSIEGKVEMVKDSYIILSLPKHKGLLAYAAITDYNVQVADDVHRKFAVGQVLAATVQLHPCASSGGRLLVAVSLINVMDVEPKGDPKRPGQPGRAAAAKKKTRVRGSIVRATVLAVHPHHVDVQVGKKTAGRLHITEVVDLAEGSLPESSPLDAFSVQQQVEVVVLSRVKKDGGSGAHRSGVMDVSMRPSVLKAARERDAAAPKEEEEVAEGAKEVADGAASPVERKVAKEPLVIPGSLSLKDITPKMRVFGIVQEIAEDHMWVMVSATVRGRVSVFDVSTDLDVLAHFHDRFKVGQGVAARVLKAVAAKSHLDLSLLPSGSDSSTEAKAGAMVVGKVLTAAGTGLKVLLGGKQTGRVAITDLHDVSVPNALDGVSVGAFVRCKVLAEADKKGGAVSLSARPSHGGQVSGVTYTTSKPDKKRKKAGKEVEDAKPASADTIAEVLDVATLSVGTMVKGYVKHVDAKGAFVSVSRNLDGRMKLRNLSDGYIENPQEAFPEGKLVEGRVISCEAGRLELTLRSASAVKVVTGRTLKDFIIGEIVVGTVRKVELFGVFVDMPGSSVVGLAHISELSDDKVKDIKGLYHQKQSVKAKILRIDLEAGKMSLGLKPRYFDGDADDGPASSGGKVKRDMDIDEEMAELEEVEEDAANIDVEVEDDDGSMDVDDEDEEKDEEENSDETDEDKDEDSDDDDDDMNEAVAAPVSMASQLDSLRSLGVTDDSGPASTNTWTELKLDDDEQEGADADDGKGDEGGKKLSKAAKKRAREEKERQIRQIEMARLQGESAPQSKVDFERLVMASPNSSFVWIKYMAFCITLGDMEQARAVAERALKVINFREEQEKFNVWVAWLNLENTYGQPPEEAVMKLFQRALQYNDQKKLYMAMLGIMERSSRTELSDQLLKTMTKKFGTSAKVWLKHLEHMLLRGDDDKGVRMLMDRALVALHARKHIKVITRAALLEFKAGSAERGRGIFEGVLRNHPKRLDLWSVYIDQEIKQGDAQRTRSLFERATHLTLPPKKMKFLFKRFLEYEKEHGDAATVDHVKKRAMEFVESTLKS